MKKLPRNENGMSLVELSLVLALAMGVMATLMTQLQTQIAIYSQIRRSNFITQESPVVGLIFSKLLSNANDYRVFASRAAAESGTSPQLTGSAVRLMFRQPNDTIREAIVAFDTIGGRPGLYFFLEAADGQFPANPSWALSNRGLAAANFDLSTGVLSLALTGEGGDSITYGAEKL